MGDGRCSPCWSIDRVRPLLEAPKPAYSAQFTMFMSPDTHLSLSDRWEFCKSQQRLQWVPPCSCGPTLSKTGNSLSAYSTQKWNCWVFSKLSWARNGNGFQWNHKSGHVRSQLISSAGYTKAEGLLNNTKSSQQYQPWLNTMCARTEGRSNKDTQHWRKAPVSQKNV